MGVAVSQTQNHTEIKMGSDRSFGLVFAGVFAIVAAFPLIGGGGLRLWALLVAVVFLAMALLVPGWLRVPNRLWFRFGLLLGRVVSPVAMGIIFLVTVTPIGIVMRMLGADPLRKTFDDGVDSYWIPVDPEKSAATSMKNQF